MKSGQYTEHTVSFQFDVFSLRIGKLNLNQELRSYLDQDCGDSKQFKQAVQLVVRSC